MFEQIKALVLHSGNSHKNTIIMLNITDPAVRIGNGWGSLPQEKVPRSGQLRMDEVSRRFARRGSPITRKTPRPLVATDIEGEFAVIYDNGAVAVVPDFHLRAVLGEYRNGDENDPITPDTLTGDEVWTLAMSGQIHFATLGAGKVVEIDYCADRGDAPYFDDRSL